MNFAGIKRFSVDTIAFMEIAGFTLLMKMKWIAFNRAQYYAIIFNAIKSISINENWKNMKFAIGIALKVASSKNVYLLLISFKFNEI